ncbi:MAG TPA: hypothetical protein VI011_22045 [Asanoa sp.]
MAMATAATATMLVVDAWFDLTSSVRHLDRVEAIAASVVEPALAAICLWIAQHADLMLRITIGDLVRRARRGRA